MPRDDLGLQDLKKADLIFTKVGNGAPNHVEMYTKNSHFAATSIHAVFNAPKQMTRVMPTSLAVNPMKHVFRCNNRPLARKARKFAANWSRFENRYEKDRIDVKTAFRQMHRNLGTTDDELTRIMIKRFMDRGRFRAIKYAARRAGVLCFPGIDGESGHGMTCCMFAITCYQTAGISHYVNKLDPLYPNARVSDKKMTGPDILMLRREMTRLGFPVNAFHEYKNYLDLIKKANEYDIDWGVAQKPEVVKGRPTPKFVGFTYRPSILSWRQPGNFLGFNWAQAVSPGMLLDSKIATPENIWNSLHADAVNWTYLGNMAAADGPAPTVEQKKAYTDGIAANQRDRSGHPSLVATIDMSVLTFPDFYTDFLWVS